MFTNGVYNPIPFFPMDSLIWHSPSIFGQRIFPSPTIMLSARRNTKVHRTVQEDVSCGDSNKDCDPDEECSRPVTERGSKPRASKKVASKQKGKQPEKRRNAGKLSKLPDIPLDILYEVGRGSILSPRPVTCIMMHSVFVDILSCPPGGSLADVVG